MRKSFLLPLLLLASCIREAPMPEGVIPRDTMVRIMMEVHLAEAKVSSRNLPSDTSNIYYAAYQKKILSKYKVSPERFEKTMEYYAKNPKELFKVEEIVVDSLSLREARGKLE